MSDDVQAIWDRLSAYEYLLVEFLANQFGRMSSEETDDIKFRLLDRASRPALGQLMTVENLQSRAMATRENVKAILLKIGEIEIGVRAAIAQDLDQPR